ncbi:MAG TPA: prolyl oligopeptidase family serine peptidase, partial [Aliidongia sp.]|uniref:alpha/beta hydrolase family protein n=1 Tax=Aliidongia sp. TaxID=1914230 RepID=UPI002DDD21AA
MVVRTVEGKTVHALKVGDIKVRNLQWAGDDYLIVLSSVTRPGGLYIPGEWNASELYSAAVVNLKSKTAFVVFFHSRDVYPVVFDTAGYRQVDGRWYGYFSGATILDNTFSKSYGNIGVISLYQVDLETGDYRRAGEGSRTWLMNSDGTPLVHASIRRDKGMVQWRLYEGRSERDLIDKQETPLGGIDLAGLGRTADTYLIQSELAPNVGLWEHSMTPGQAPVNLTSASIVSLLQDSSGLAIGAKLEGDIPQTLLFDPARKASFEAVKQAFAPANVELLSFDTSGKRMTVLATSPTDSGTYFMVDLSHQNVEKLGSAYPGVQGDAIGAVSMVHYKAADVLALEGVLTLPPGSAGKNLPLVVLPHGGPEARDHLGFDWTAQAFAGRGYAVFQPNFRGSGGFGTVFRDAGFGEWGRKMQTDISDGVAELAR